MINASSISHALILEDGEVALLQADHLTPLRRRAPTRLRMRIAFYRHSTRTIVGTAKLSSASAENENERSYWHFEEVEWLDTPLAISSAKSGPIWIRLSQQERGALLASATSQQPLSRDEDLILDHTNDGPGLSAEILSEGGWTAASPAFDNAESEIVELEAGGTSSSTPAPRLAEEHQIERGESPDPIEAARIIASAFVPNGNVSPEEARRILVRLRDQEIKPSFPHVLPSTGILRRAMMQSLLEEGVSNREEYMRLVPADLRLATDKTHIAAYLDAILAILARIEEPIVASAKGRTGRKTPK